MADLINEMLGKFMALSQEEKQISADRDAAFKEYNDYCAGSDADLNKKIGEIHEKMAKLDRFVQYAKEHAQPDGLEDATEPFDTSEGTLESIRQTIKLESHNDPNAESLYTKATGKKLYYEQEIERTRKLIEGSKVQAKRQYDSDVSGLNDRQQQHEDKVKAYIQSSDFKDYLRMLMFDKSAFNSPGIVTLPEKNAVSIGQRRVRMSVPMDIEQDLAMTSNGEYNAAARTIGAPLQVSMKKGSVLYLDFDERNEQYLLGGIQRLLLNVIKYFGSDIEDMYFCEPVNFSPDCLGHIAALGKGANPFIAVPQSMEEAQSTLARISAQLKYDPAPGKVSRVVVLHGFPEKYDFSMTDKVLSLCRSAEQSGALVVLTHKNSAEENAAVKEIRGLSEVIRSRNGGFWIEKTRESFFWYSAPSDIPMEIRKVYIEERRQQPVKSEPVSEAAHIAEEPAVQPVAAAPVAVAEADEEMLDFGGISGIDDKPVETDDIREPMNFAEPDEEPEPVSFAKPEPDEEPEPVDFAEPEPDEEPEPVDFAEPEPDEEPEPVSFAEPEPDEEPEPVSFAETEPDEEPEPVSFAETEPDEEPEPVSFAELEPDEEPEPVNFAEPEPDEEPEPVDFAEPEPDEEPVQDPIDPMSMSENGEPIPAHILFSLPRPKPEEKEVTVTVVSELREKLPPVFDPLAPKEIKPEEKVSEPAEEKISEPAEEKISEPAEEKVPEPAEEKISEPAEDRTSEPVYEAPGSSVPAKGKRLLPAVMIGKDVEGDPVSMDISGNITYICGKHGSERTALSERIIAQIIADVHPDDAELWLFDCGDGEFMKKYAEDPAEHIKYVVVDSSPETSLDLIDVLSNELDSRISKFGDNGWNGISDVPAGEFMPRIVVAINEFPKMSQNIGSAPKFFGRNHSDKLTKLFKNCADYGIHFLLIGSTFSENGKRPACLEGCAVHCAAAVAGRDTASREMFGAIKLYENEIESLKRIPAGCAFTATEDSQNGLTLVRITGSNAEKTRKYSVASEYSEDPSKYVDKHSLIAGRRAQISYDERRAPRSEMIMSRAEDETLLFLGEPCRFMAEYPVRLYNDFGENILAIAPAREKVSAALTIASTLRSLEEQGIPAEILASRSNPVYSELKNDGYLDGVRVFEGDKATARVKEIAAEISDGKCRGTFEIVLGGDLLLAAMHAEDSISDLKRSLVKGPRMGVHFMFVSGSAAQHATGFMSLFRHKIVFACPYSEAEKVLRDPNCDLPENAFRLSNDYDEITILPYLM